MKKILLALAVLAALSFAALTFAMFLFNSDKQKQCQNLLAIAEDEKKTAYLYDWIENNLENPALYEVLGSSDSIYHSHSNSERFRSLGVDWSQLRLDFDIASLTLIRSDEDWTDFTNPHNVKAVSFGQTRNSIILKIDPKFQTESLGGGDYRREVQVVNDRVSVYCD